MILFQFLGGLLFGIFAMPCILCDEEDLGCIHIVLGIIFLPFTIILMMGLGVKMLICDNSENIGEMLCSPCEILREIM